MKIKFVFACASALLAFAASSQAGTPVQQILYNVDAGAQCSQAAQTGDGLRLGLEHCNTALRDPLMNQRGAVLVDRGIIKAKLNDVNGALADYRTAIALNAGGDAFVNRAIVYISLKRYDDARADLARGMQLGGENMAVAYYSRGAIEDDTGDYQAAYRDYKQALTVNPNYEPAKRELARFKVTRRTAAN
jgi:tetratricopeptide (TPR) repeat protein